MTIKFKKTILAVALAVAGLTSSQGIEPPVSISATMGDYPNVVPGNYYYRAQARDNQTNSRFSTDAQGYQLIAPTELKAGKGSLTYGIALSWKPADYAARYEVWRHESTGAVDTAVCLTNVVGTNWIDNSAWPVRHYVYRLRSVSSTNADNATVSKFSAEAEGWRSPAVALDYDLDNQADPVLYNEIGGQWYFYLSGQNYSLTPIAVGGFGFAALSGDYDGDGRADLALCNTKSGIWGVLLSASDYEVDKALILSFSANKARPVAGDFDGDGKADPAFYDEASGFWLMLLSDQKYEESFRHFGGAGWRPVPGDYDGDGKTDLAVYNELLGEWAVAFSSQGYKAVNAAFGGPWCQPVQADYDGDGKTDPAVYNKISSEWQVMMSGANYALATTLFGVPGCQPVQADYDGDGKADPMLRHTASGTWGGMFSGSGYTVVQATLSGAGAGWRPVSATYNPGFVFIAFGDSITYGYGSSSQSTNTGYPLLLEHKLNADFGNQFVSINRGIDGEDTGEGIARIASVLDTYAPQLLLLMEGINDLGGARPYGSIENNLRFMIEAALARGIPVVLATIPPTISNNYVNRSAQYARIIGFNPRIYNIAADYNLPVAQVFEAITSVPNWQNILMEQESGNHPNDAGYQYVVGAFYNVITDALNNGVFQP